MAADAPPGRIFRARSLCGRADLLRARAAGMLPVMAELLGYKLRDPIVSEPRRRTARASAKTPPQESPKEGPSAMAFWRVVGYEAVDSEREENKPRSGKKRKASTQWNGSESKPLAAPPLGTFSALLPGLRRAAAEPRETNEPDIRGVLRQIERGQTLDDLPKAKRRRWGDALWVISDRDERLIPYREDYSRMYRDIAKLFAQGAIHGALWRGDGHDPVPPPGTVVVAMTDLGLLSEGGGRAAREWLAYGRTLHGAGCRPVAVLPATGLRRLDGVARFWEIIGWRRLSDPLDATRRRELLQDLLTLASPAVRVEPGLLRELRLMLGAEADPGLEAAFWQSSALLSRHPLAATLEPEERKKSLSLFASLDRDKRKKALKAIRGWRRQDMISVWDEETLGLDANSRSLISPRDLAAVSKDLIEIADLVERGAAPAGALAWFRRVTRRLPRDAWSSLRDSEERVALMRLWRASHPESKSPPPGFDQALLPRSAEPRRKFILRQRGDRLIAAPEGEPFSQGGVLGTIVARREEFTVEGHDYFWKSGAAPAFARDWGWDEFGAFLRILGARAGRSGRATHALDIGPGGFSWVRRRTRTSVTRTKVRSTR